MTLELLTAQEEQDTPVPLKIRGLTVSYGEKPAVFSADMTVRAGELTAIVGPNGAGKSTLLKAALGIVAPLAGHVEFFDLPLEAGRGIDDLATLQWYLKRRRQRKRFDPEQYSLELPGYESRRRR